MLIITPESDKEARVSPPLLDVELNSYGFPQGYFILRSIGTGRVLDLCQGIKDDGTSIILWPATETSLVEREYEDVCVAQSIDSAL